MNTKEMPSKNANQLKSRFKRALHEIHTLKEPQTVESH